MATEDNPLLMLLNEIVQGAQLGGPKAPVFRQHDREEPEFGVGLGLLDVDLHGLPALIAEEEKAVAAVAEDFGHHPASAARDRPGDQLCAAPISGAARRPPANRNLV
jgi:hypothetical protein